MTHITNEMGIDLPLAVWLVTDDYDYVEKENYISATTLIKPIKQIILSSRVKSNTRTIDISSLINARMGVAIHDSVEKAWKNNYRKALKLLGYSEEDIEKVKINPFEPKEEDFNIYLEQRSFKTVSGFTIGGKFDTVLNGQLFDTKSTSVYSYIFGSKDNDYILQGSIYRWLNPEIITGNTIKISFVFTDWQKSEAKKNSSYPQSRLITYELDLMSLLETDNYIKNKLQILNNLWNKPEEEIPPCNDKELWRSDPVYKYYSDPSKTDGRSTRNFSTFKEAHEFKASKGKGVVITVPGEVKACLYCRSFEICKQKDNYNVG